MVRSVCFVALLIGAMVVNCSNTIDPLTHISEIKVVLDRYYIAQQKEDMTALSALFAQDVDLVVFGIGVEERLVGWEAVQGMFQRQMDSVEGLQTHPADQVTKISKGGKAAWVSSLNHVRGTIGTQTVEMDYRTTIVLEKRGKKWLIVHVHNSLQTGQERQGS
ncbi:MAG: nuclear transport factor 2 family protein [Gemmatimonadota bacterium]|nr:MAG: nuclear transport factor 2 family protein [Gemmatimonadota bacterium]